MLNRYPWWKYLIIGLVLVIGIIYALPNLFGEDPAVQISPARTGLEIDQPMYARVIDKLESEQLDYKSAAFDAQRLLVRFSDTEVQLKAADILRELLGRDYTVALNLAPSTPEFMRALGLAPMYLGLDLRGGVHFLMEVDMDAAISQAEESYLESLRTLLRDQRIRYTALNREPASAANPDLGSSIRASFRSAEDREQALSQIRDELNTLDITESDQGFDLILRMTPQEIEERRSTALAQNMTTLRNRVNELGVAEPVIQQQGDNRIVIQLPGVQDTARAKEILGATATLEFRLVYGGDGTQARIDAAQAESTGRKPFDAKLYKIRGGGSILLQNRVILTGDSITDAGAGFDSLNGSPNVRIVLDGQGASRMTNATRDQIGKDMSVVFIETHYQTVEKDGKTEVKPSRVEEVINVATIRDVLGKNFQITGLDNPQEARNLALLLRAGSLAAPIYIVEERTVGPSAGKENIEQGFSSALVAFALVLIFMAFYYRMFGLISDMALMFNLVLIVALLSMLQATLTLPGIAGIILTIGMAVDANVLIFERIREELKLGNTPQAAIHTGFDRAFGTILDANITTLIAAVVLFGLGTGPVKGFAVTLSLGILTSMFTAVMGTRAVVNYLYGGRRLQTLPI